MQNFWWLKHDNVQTGFMHIKLHLCMLSERDPLCLPWYYSTSNMKTVLN